MNPPPSGVLTLVVYLLVAYLLGSIPFSQLVTSLRTPLDLRQTGEGNVGSRNVWHLVGPSWGLLAAALDTGKGFLAFAAGGPVHVPLVGMLLGGVAVLLGHQFPIFLHGQGGKGLATSLGVLLGLTPLSSLAGLGVLGLAQAAFRDFNRSIVVGVIAIIVLPLLFGQPLWVAAYALGLAVLTGLKKLLDRPHETQVWSSQPWQGRSRPGLRADGSERTPPSDPTPPS